jgi:hypothetical protein
MPLSLIDVRRIAAAVASEHDMTLQVVGARAANIHHTRKFFSTSAAVPNSHVSW